MGIKNLSQVQNNNRQCNGTEACIRQTCPDQTQTTFEFGKTEFSFDFDSFTNINVFLFFINHCVFRWATECRT